ncbi:UNVERIFIED_CONTAM: hypothetical protein FKN15_014630 [Acipenser sinensis]
MLLYWVKFKNNPGTPDPNAEENPSEARAVASANENVIEATERPERKPYLVYESSTQAKIARYATLNGNAGAVRKFSIELGHGLNESTPAEGVVVRGLNTANSKQDHGVTNTGPHRTRTAPITQRETSVKSEPFYVFSDPRANTLQDRALSSEKDGCPVEDLFLS